MIRVLDNPFWRRSFARGLRPCGNGACCLSLCVLAAMLASAGCRSGLDVGSLRDPRKTAALTSTDDIAGPLERLVRNNDRERIGGPPSEKAVAEYRAAEALFNDGKFEEAEEAFKAITKQYKHNWWSSPLAEKSTWNRKTKYEQSYLVEDSLFMIAECQHRQKQYSWAQDSYDLLVKEYPTSRHLDTYSQRMFEIARIWLQQPEIVTAGDVQQANFDDLKSTPLPVTEKKPERDPTRLIPILPNIADRSRPLFDTEGRALQALRNIWMNDPTGPLADDALMLTASHFVKQGDFVEADRYYTTLREEYPKSPHLENAFILGSHVKLMTYEGPEYDGSVLEESRELKESTLKLYPQHPERERMLEEVRKIDEAKARHAWEMVEFYQTKRKPRAVAMYCRTVIEKFPQTPYADRARQLLGRLPPEAVRGIVPDSMYRLPPPPAEAPIAPPEAPPAEDEPAGRVRL